MPTAAKPPPEHDVSQLVLGLFVWLRDAGHTTAAVPALARRGIATALSDGRLTGLAKTIATAFLIALDTWIHCATPQMRDRYQQSAKRELASTLASWVRDDEHRSEAIRILQAFPLTRLSTLIAHIAQSSVERAVRPAGSNEDQQGIRDTWLRDSELLTEILRDLEQKLRTPRGVAFPRTLKEWTQFEQALVQRLRKAGLSYGGIAKLRRSAGKGNDAPPEKQRMERERVRGSARRAKSRKA